MLETLRTPQLLVTHQCAQNAPVGWLTQSSFLITHQCAQFAPVGRLTHSSFILWMPLQQISKQEPLLRLRICQRAPNCLMYRPDLDDLVYILSAHGNPLSTLTSLSAHEITPPSGRLLFLCQLTEALPPLRCLPPMFLHVAQQHTRRTIPCTSQLPSIARAQQCTSSGPRPLLVCSKALIPSHLRVWQVWQMNHLK